MSTFNVSEAEQTIADIGRKVSINYSPSLEPTVRNSVENFIEKIKSGECPIRYLSSKKEPKPITHAELKKFPFRIIVAGTRGYEDYNFFSSTIFSYLKSLGYDKEKIVFVSGAAKSGVDAMIIRWCKENDYPWIEFKPNWNKIDVKGAVIKYRDGKPYNATAGFQCNEEMAEIGTNLITFYDGVSSGTSDMIDRMTARGNPCRVVIVSIEK